MKIIKLVFKFINHNEKYINIFVYHIYIDYIFLDTTKIFKLKEYIEKKIIFENKLDCYQFVGENSQKMSKNVISNNCAIEFKDIQKYCFIFCKGLQLNPINYAKNRHTYDYSIEIDLNNRIILRRMS